MRWQGWRVCCICSCLGMGIENVAGRNYRAGKWQVPPSPRGTLTDAAAWKEKESVGVVCESWPGPYLVSNQDLVLGPS